MEVSGAFINTKSKQCCAIHVLSFSEVQCKFQDSGAVGCGAASLGDEAQRFKRSNAFIFKGQMK